MHGDGVTIGLIVRVTTHPERFNICKIAFIVKVMRTNIHLLNQRFPWLTEDSLYENPFDKNATKIELYDEVVSKLQF